jgi:uncharacterized membrane protein YjfL (UPF0719 family)
MKTSDRQSWLRAMLIASILYIVIGIIFPLFSKSSATNSLPNIWRVISFLVSAVVFGIHIGYEHSRLNKTPLIIAFHTALAVAIGTIALAVFAYIRVLLASSNSHSTILIAILIWPIVTGILSFLVALVAAVIITRIKNKSTMKNT